MAKLFELTLKALNHDTQCYLLMLFICHLADIGMVLSVRPSGRPSVCLSVTPFLPLSHHPIFTKLAGYFGIE